MTEPVDDREPHLALREQYPRFESMMSACLPEGKRCLFFSAGPDLGNSAVIFAQGEEAELEAKIADAVFSCPGCGRHDFGFFASQIKAACGPCRTRAEAAEAREAQHLARIAELEDANGLDEAAHLARISELCRDNEQHLADIKALRRQLDLSNEVVEYVGCYAVLVRVNRDVLARLAHYDDAK